MKRRNEPQRETTDDGLTVTRRAALGGLAGLVGASVLGDVEAQASDAETDDETAEEVDDPLDDLGGRPLEPTDRDLFVPSVYPETPALAPAEEYYWSERDFETFLAALFSRRTDGNPNGLDEAADALGDAALADTIPDVRLRAAVVAMRRTAVEEAFDIYRTPAIERVEFSTLPTDAVATVVPGDDRTGARVYVNYAYEYEDVRHFVPALLNAALCHAPPLSGRKRLVAHALKTLVYGDLVVESPELAWTGTELARRQNTELLARVNTRDEDGDLRLLESGANVYPHGEPMTSFAAPFSWQDSPSSPGNDCLRALLTHVTGRPWSETAFDTVTVGWLDYQQRYLSSPEVRLLAKALRLTPPEEPIPEPEGDVPPPDALDWPTISMRTY